MFLSEIFLSEQQDAVAIIFGRFNPPHKGHRAAWETAAQYPRWYVGTNQSTQGPKDPLPYDIKIEAMKTIWPEVEDHIVAEQSWLTLASKVFDEHGEVTLVCCTDEEWVTKTIVQYNGQQGAHGYYNFPEIRQEPTPRLSSATALRDAVKAGDREAFSDAAGVSADTPVAGKPFFDLVAEYLLPYQNAPKRTTKKKDTELPETEVSEGWKGKAGAAALAAATAVGIGMSPKLTVDGVTYDKAISAPPEDAKTVTKDGKRYKVWQSSPLKQRPGGGKYNLYKQIDESAWPFDHLINEEAAGVGVIANKKQAKDPRYSMSLTKDVRPGEVERSLKKLRLK